MGLHFIFGRAGCGKTTTCCQQIADYLLQNKENHAIFLVPDQGTYKAESTLASIKKDLQMQQYLDFLDYLIVYFKNFIPKQAKLFLRLDNN